MSKDAHRHRAHRPVFVDASGRRQRAVRVAGAILVVPAVAYVSVLLSTVLGGPTIQSPFLPLPPVPAPATVASQHPKPSPTSRMTSGPFQPSVGGVVSTQRPTGQATIAPAPLATSPSTAATAPASVPTSTPPATSRPKGKPTSLPTPTNRPTKSPR